MGTVPGLAAVENYERSLKRYFLGSYGVYLAPDCLYFKPHGSKALIVKSCPANMVCAD